MRLSMLALAILAIAAPLAGQTGAEEFLEAEAVAEYNRFQLFAECAPVYLSVVVMDLSVEDAERRRAAGEVHTERAARLAESRLRGARLYAGRAPSSRWDNLSMPRLSVIGALADGAVLVGSVSLDKIFYDPASGVSVPHGAFSRRVRSGTPVHLMQESLSELLDEFILEYLRVNEGYC